MPALAISVQETESSGFMSACQQDKPQTWQCLCGSAEARSAETTACPVTPPERQLLPAPPVMHPRRPEEVRL